MRLTAIGTSGSFPGPGNPASSYLLTTDGPAPAHVVLDMGSGALGGLQRYVDPAEIDAVVLSHLHPDHCLDLTGLYVARSYDPRFFTQGLTMPALPVFGPAGTAERLHAAYDVLPGASPAADSWHATDLSSVFTFSTLSAGTAFDAAGLECRAFLVNHPVEAYAVRIRSASGRTLCYSGDTDVCDEIVEAARGADVFLCEAAFQEGRDEARDIHLTGRRAGIVAREAGVARLVLTHIPPWTDPQVVAAEAAAEFAGPLEVASPGRSWDI